MVDENWDFLDRLWNGYLVEGQVMGELPCTWVGCTEKGTNPQPDKMGRAWALLCSSHEDSLKEALDSGDAKRILGSWVKASGGAKIMAERMVKATGPQLADLLSRASKKKK